MVTEHRKAEKFLLMVASKTYKIKSIAEESGLKRNSISEFKRSGHISEHKLSLLREWFINNGIWVCEIPIDKCYQPLSEYIVLLEKICSSIASHGEGDKNVGSFDKIQNDLEKHIFESGIDVDDQLHVDEDTLFEKLESVNSLAEKLSEDNLKKILSIFRKICDTHHQIKAFDFMVNIVRSGNSIPKWIPFSSEFFVFAPGNHDIDRQAVNMCCEFFSEEISKYKTFKDLLNFPDKEDVWPQYQDQNLLSEQLLVFLSECDYFDKIHEIKVIEDYLTSMVRCDISCSNCNKKTPSKGKYCMHCGNKLKSLGGMLHTGILDEEALKKGLIQALILQYLSSAASERNT